MAGSRPKEFIRDVEVDDGRRQQTTNAQPNRPTASSTAPKAPSKETFTYLNDGTQIIKGLANQSGHVKGNNNACVNYDPKKKDLVGDLNRMEAPKNGSPTTPTPSNDSSTRLSGNYFRNAGVQMMQGLANQIGYIEGDGNGCIS